MEKEENKKKSNKSRKILLVAIICLCLITVTIAIIVVLIRNNEEKARVLNEKLDKCFSAIYNDYNYDEYKEIVASIEDEEGKDRAYNKLNEALTECVNDLKEQYSAEQYYKLYDLFEGISNDSDTNMQISEIVENNKKVNEYNEYMRLGKYHEDKKEFIEAYTCYSSALRESKSLDEEKKNEAQNKKNSTKDKACEDLKKDLKKRIKEKDYSYMSDYTSFIEESNDKELESLYKQYKNDKSAKELEEEKAKKKKRGVTIGMTKQEVLDSIWGEPEDINTSTGIWGVHEQWIYGNGNYLYFENGRLTAIQN